MRLSTLLWLPLGLSATGCPPTPQCSGQTYGECCADLDCGRGGACLRGLCVAACMKTGCPEDEYCNNPYSAENGGCAPRVGFGGQCWFDGCKQGLFWLEGKCASDCVGGLGTVCEDGAGFCSRGPPDHPQACRKACANNDDCSPIACVSLASAGGAQVCVQQFGLGAPCLEDGQCGDRVCTVEQFTRHTDGQPACMDACMRDGCTPDSYCTYDNGCVPKRVLGDQCDGDYQCSGRCQMGPVGWDSFCTEDCATVGDSCAEGTGVCGQMVVWPSGGGPGMALVCRPRCAADADCEFRPGAVPYPRRTCGPLAATGGVATCYDNTRE